MSGNQHVVIRILLGAIAGVLATDVFAQAAPASIEWILIQSVPMIGGSAMALLGLLLLAVGLVEMYRRRSIIRGVLLVPLVAGALLTFQFSTHLVDAARAVTSIILLDTSPKALNDGLNIVENIQNAPVSITALNNGACVIDQSQADAPACQVGSTLDSGATCNVFVSCSLTGMYPGSTDVYSADGIDDTGVLDFRCLEWDENSCIRPQSRVPASTCASYVDADVWHDMTFYNSPEERICPSFCAAVTDSGTVVECVSTGVTATGTANDNYSTGYSATETGCLSASDARWRIDYTGQDGTYNIRHSNYGASTPRLRIQCDWASP